MLDHALGNEINKNRIIIFKRNGIRVDIEEMNY